MLAGVCTAGLIAVAALLAAPTATAWADETYENAHLSDQDRADLVRVDAYLNAIRTMKGEFTQITNQGGVGKGRFYIRKPGRVRFEYDPPSSVLLISDGTQVSVENTELETVSSYPLSATPLKLLLKDEINLERDTLILGVIHSDEHMFVTAREEEGLAEGDLTMVFTQGDDIELVQWTVKDAQGVETSIILDNVEKGIRLRSRLFRPTEYDWD